MNANASGFSLKLTTTLDMTTNFKTMKQYIGQELELKEMPQLRFGNPNVTVGKKYLIVDVEGSNFWLIDDDGEKSTIGCSRFGI